MGNRPKMSLKYAIFKICPKLARKWYSCETKVYSTIFGDSWRQKVVSVFGFGHPKSHFFAPKITENGRFRVQKNGTWDAQIKKQRPLFVANYPQNWWNRNNKNIVYKRWEYFVKTSGCVCVWVGQRDICRAKSAIWDAPAPEEQFVGDKQSKECQHRRSCLE